VRLSAFAILTALGLAAHAEELTLFAGATRSDAPDARTFGLGLSYMHEIAPHVEATVAYRNEGHIPGHHRDGHSTQLWLASGPISSGLSFAVGAGPYHYFDTSVAERGGGDFADAHGWGMLYGVAARWGSPDSRWTYRLRAERVLTRHDLDTTTVLLGVGYRLEQDGSFASNAEVRTWARDRNDELTVSVGQTIVNSFESQSALARTVEYRHAFGPVLRASLAWVNEGDARLIRRDGVVVQGWLEPSFYRDRFTLGVGYGAYLAVDRYRPDKRDLMGIVTTTASCRLAAQWVGRFSWHRIVSRNDRDSDIILLGVGYLF
jgi:hypothetical protein